MACDVNLARERGCRYHSRIAVWMLEFRHVHDCIVDLLLDFFKGGLLRQGVAGKLAQCLCAVETFAGAGKMPLESVMENQRIDDECGIPHVVTICFQKLFDVASFVHLDVRGWDSIRRRRPLQSASEPCGISWGLLMLCNYF